MSDQSDPSVAARRALTETGHLLEARVYYANTDLSGAVNHARHLEFLARGRIEYLRLVGVHHAELADGKNGEQSIWIIRRMKKINGMSLAQLDPILEKQNGVLTSQM